MVPIISIRMGDMLGHGSWSMSWLVARGSRGCVEYLPTYIPTYPTHSVRASSNGTHFWLRKFAKQRHWRSEVK